MSELIKNYDLLHIEKDEEPVGIFIAFDVSRLRFNRVHTILALSRRLGHSRTCTHYFLRAHGCCVVSGAAPQLVRVFLPHSGRRAREQA